MTPPVPELTNELEYGSIEVQKYRSRKVVLDAHSVGHDTTC